YYCYCCRHPAPPAISPLSLHDALPIFGHRHTAEIEQELRLSGAPLRVDLSVTAVELVRGVLATAHAYLGATLEDKDLWRIYRDAYGAEPFVRIVKERAGIYRYPEPKLLAGT